MQRKRKRQRKLNNRFGVPNKNFYIIKRSIRLGYNISTGLIIDSAATNRDNLISYLTGDGNFSTYVKNQYAYFRVRSISIQFVPIQYTETTDADNMVIISAIRFGKFEDSNLSLGDVEQIPGSCKINCARRKVVHNINKDTTFYPSTCSSGANNFSPVAFLYIQPDVTPNTTADYMTLTMEFHVECKERII